MLGTAIGGRASLTWNSRSRDQTPYHITLAKLGKNDKTDYNTGAISVTGSIDLLLAGLDSDIGTFRGTFGVVDVRCWMYANSGLACGRA